MFKTFAAKSPEILETLINAFVSGEDVDTVDAVSYAVSGSTYHAAILFTPVVEEEE